MKKLLSTNSDKGFTYVEVIIAAAIMAILLTPVLAGFHQSGRNFTYAMNSYTADLLAANLIIDTEKAICVTGTTDLFSDLDGGYDEQFDYIITVRELSGDIWTFVSCPGLVSTGGADVSIDLVLPVDEPVFTGLTISYDNGFSVAGGLGGQVITEDNRCRIIMDENAVVRLNIENMSDDIYILLDNNHEAVSYLDIYKSAAILEERIRLGYLHHSGGTVVRYYDRIVQQNKGYVIMVEVFDKNGKLLKKAADFVYSG